MKFIPIYEPSISQKAKDYVNEALDSTWISSRGEFLDKFTASFCKYTGIKAATPVSNGTVALHLALLALEIKAGDEVIVPTFTYVASVNAIVMTGATPVFIDSLAETLQLDPSKIEPAITSKTKAIIAPHLYGFACDMEKIMAIAKKHKLFVVEDVAESLGTTYKGKHVGGFGDIATYSFFGNKTVTTGEGGMVASNNELLIKKSAHLKGQGLESLNPEKKTHREYWHDVIGYNYRMTNIQAAIGLSQMEEIENILEKKRTVAKLYFENINKNAKVLYEMKDIISSYWMVVILFKTAEITTKVRHALKEANVETRPLFPPVHTMPMYNTGAKFEVADEISFKGVNIPSFPNLTKEQILYICKIINEAIK